MSTEHKVKQSEIRRDAAQVALTNTQRQMIAQLEEAYSEAQSGARSACVARPERGDGGRKPAPDEACLPGGEATVLEVVDAESAYVTAENAREDGRVRYETARAELQTLTGTK